MNMNQQMPTDQPKVEQKEVSRKYEVKDNGDVVLTEKSTTEVTFKARQFISHVRQQEQKLEDTNNQLSKKYVDALKKYKKDVEDIIKPMKPIQEKVDKIVQAQHIEQQKQGTIKQLKHMLNQKEVNNNILGAIWSQVPKEHKEDIMKALTKEEQTKVLNLKIDKMKGEMGKK